MTHLAYKIKHLPEHDARIPMETSPGLEKPTPEADEILSIARALIQQNMVQQTIYSVQMILYTAMYQKQGRIDKASLNWMLKVMLTELIDEQAQEIENFVTAGDAHDF